MSVSDQVSSSNQPFESHRPRAFLSVSDKTGLDRLASALVAAGYQLFSTGGTRKSLEAAGLEVVEVAAYTGFPEMLGGRVKTLHPKVFGGILARRDVPADLQVVAEHGIALFDVVVVNLYPFEETIARQQTTLSEAIEQIDVGGPSLIRAAGKNHAAVVVLSSPDQYEDFMQQLASGGETTLAYRQQLAAAAFAHTAGYDSIIANYFRQQLDSQEHTTEFPQRLVLTLERRQTLRYGENPHQRAAFYVEDNPPTGTVASALQVHGKELSYNNLLDLDSAWAMVRQGQQPMCVVVKHNNPCGGAMAETLSTAFLRAIGGDPTSAFGSIVALNRPVDGPTAQAMCEPGLFLEAIIAPEFHAEALEQLTTRPKWKNNVRLLAAGHLPQSIGGLDYRRLEGSLLVQDRDEEFDLPSQWDLVTDRAPDPRELADLAFAWHMVRFVKSNAIVLVSDQTLWGVGAGQMSRVDSVHIAITKAGDRASGCVLASDAFFPFADSIEQAASAGVRAVVQPGGSKGDQAVIEACNARGVAMLLTGRRHFKH